MKKITILLIAISFSAFGQMTIDFEVNGIGLDWNWIVDENGANNPLEFVSNPNTTALNTSENTAKIIASPNGQPWALTYTDDGGEITFTETNSLVKMMVLKTVSTPVAIKFEDSTNPSYYKQIEVTNNIINGEWEELTFDFSTVIGNTYDRMVIIPDFLERSQPHEVYFDQISFEGGGAIEDYELEDIDFEIDGFGANWVWTVHNNHSNPALEVVSNPNISDSNNTEEVAQFTSLAEGAPWALTFTDNIGTFLLDSDHRIITLKVLKTVQTNFGIKLEYIDPTNNEMLYFSEILAPTTITNGDWEQLVFDFSSDIGTAFNRLTIIPDFADRSQTNISYFDQISFGSTAGLDSNITSIIKLYPNPATDFVQLSVNSNKSMDVEIFDALGKSVKRIFNSQTNINIHDLKSGVYFVLLKIGDRLITKKLLVH